MSPGARFTVILVSGIANPLLASADETRFTDSFTAASGSPTTKVLGSPRSPEFTSISTGSASTPTSAPELTLANILPEFFTLKNILQKIIIFCGASAQAQRRRA